MKPNARPRRPRRRRPPSFFPPQEDLPLLRR